MKFNTKTRSENALINVITGIGIDIEMGQTRSAKHYISISVRLGFGFDIGVSGGANASWYENGPTTEKDYNPKHMGGAFWYGSFGVIASGEVSSSIISDDAKKIRRLS